MPRVDIPSKNTYIDFPDGMQEEEMSQAINDNWDSILPQKPPSALESFTNELQRVIPQAKADIQSLFGASEKAEEGLSRLEQDQPSSGAGGFAGKAVSGILPTALAVAGTATPAAPFLWAGVLGYYGLTSMGQARRGVHEFEETTGKDVSGGTEALVTVGVGAVNTVSEYLFKSPFLKNISASMTRETLERIGKAAVKSGSDKSAKLIAKETADALWPMVVKTSAFEGTQEAFQQAATNALEGIYNPEKRSVSGLAEGVPAAFALGAAGGALITPLVRRSALSSATKEGKAYQDYVRKYGYKETVYEKDMAAPKLLNAPGEGVPSRDIGSGTFYVAKDGTTVHVTEAGTIEKPSRSAEAMKAYSESATFIADNVTKELLADNASKREANLVIVKAGEQATDVEGNLIWSHPDNKTAVTPRVLSRVATAFKYIKNYMKTAPGYEGKLGERVAVQVVKASDWKSVVDSYISSEAKGAYEAEAFTQGNTIYVREIGGKNTAHYVKVLAHELVHTQSWEAAPDTEGRRYNEMPEEQAASQVEFIVMDDLADNMHPKELFQKDVQGGTIAANSEKVQQQIRHFQELGFPISEIAFSSEQLFHPEDGSPVHAFVDPNTGRLVLSPFVEANTVPHEVLELMKVYAPDVDPMIEQGKQLISGDKEKLFNELGNLLDQRLQDKSQAEKLKMWLLDFWSYAKDTLGIQLNLRDIAARIDSRMKAGVEPVWARGMEAEGEQGARSTSLNEIQIGLRFFDNLEKIQGRVNLNQLPLKNLSKEEVAFIQSVVDEVKAETGRTSIPVKEFKDIVSQRLVPISIEGRFGLERVPTVGNGGDPKTFGVSDAYRYLFDTPIDFGEEAHSGITSTTAAGWFEAGALDADAKTLVVFEVQPSDAVKEIGEYNPINSLYLLTDEADDRLNLADGNYIKKTFDGFELYGRSDFGSESITNKEAEGLVTSIGIKRNSDKGFDAIAPSINKFFYRSIVQWAAKNGYSKVRFPVGKSVEEIEGVDVERDVAVYLNGKRITGVEQAKDLIQQPYIDVLRSAMLEARDTGQVGRYPSLKRIGVEVKAIEVPSGTVQLYNNLAERMKKEYVGRAKEVPSPEDVDKITAQDRINTPKIQFPFLEITLKPEDATAPARLFQKATAKDRAGSTNIPKMKLTVLEEALVRDSLSDLHQTTKWSAIDKAADVLLSNPHSMIRLVQEAERGKAANAGELRAMGILARNAAKKMTQATMEESEYTKTEAYQTGQRILKANDKFRYQSGLAQNSLNMFGRDMRRMTDSLIQKRVEQKALSKEELERYNKLDWTDPFAINRFNRDLKLPNWYDYLKDIYTYGLVSGPRLLLVNNPGINSLWITYLLGHRATSSFAGRLLGNRKTYAGETMKMVKSIEGSYKRAFQRGKEALLTGETPTMDTRWEQDITDGMKSSFARSPYGWLRKIAPVLEGPIRILKAGDLFNKTIAYDMQLNALAHRSALNKGLEDGTAEYDSYTAELLKNPPEEMKKNAAEFSKTATLVNDPGKITKGMLTIRNAVPFSYTVMPFVVTLSNIMNRGMELTPGLGLAVGKYNNLSTASILAKQIEGALLTWLLAEMFKDRLTAGMPANPAEREAFIRQGKLPWSVKINESWVPYKGLEPLSTPFAFFATALETMKRATTAQEGGEVFSSLANNVTQYFIDSQYFNNVLGLFQKDKRPSIVRRIPAGFVPFSSFIRQVSNMYRQVNGEPIYSKDTQSVLDEIGNTIPGLRDAPPKINAFGENMNQPRASWHMWYPFNFSEATTDPVEVELERLNKATDGAMGYPQKPDSFIEIRGVKYKIPDDTLREFAYAYGRATKEAAQKMMESQNYSKWSDERKVLALHRIINVYRARENAKFKREFQKVGREVRPMYEGLQGR